MKVLHLLKTAVGASWALRQTRELVKLGIDVHVALPDGPMVAKYEAEGVHVHQLQTALNIRNPLANLKTFRALRQLVAEIQPDLIHSHFVATTLTMRLALRASDIPRIFHVPGPLHLEHGFFRRLDLWTASKHDHWLASCEWTRRCYQRNGIDASRLGLAYYGVDVEAHHGNNTGKMHQEYGIPDDAPVVGNVAFFYPPKAYLGQKRGLKGHEDLIDAVDLVAQDIPELHCIFVGGPWGDSDDYYQSVKQYAAKKQHGKFIFTGTRHDVQDIYAELDVAIHPSHSENVGGAVESLLSGVATITSNVGGFPDLIKPDQTGWLVPKADPQALAEAIRDALNNPQKRHQFAAQGYDLAAYLLNVKNNASDIARYYQNLANHNCLTPAKTKESTNEASV
ncbi:glycosyltransferase [Neiella marina]|uniref:Glycosyltransferase n=1 Tax=Neiella holothuriorum TaxID=2870530 RepID=A0ABS7EDY4_9GAMM|nr:glycosyltransferase [Neiella holothuriorum]MBW8190547.1 glycosyltransferase [Neiella holothuriorum]